MIEIIVIYLLARRIGKNARSKGFKPLRYQVLLIGLWFFLELLLGAFGYVLFGETELVCAAYILAIFGAFMGAGLAFLIVKLRKPVVSQELEYVEPQHSPQPETDLEIDTERPKAIPDSGHAWLQIQTGPSAGQTFQLFDGALVGRGSMCDLSIPDQGISRLHLRLRYAEGTWFAQDQGGTQGTFVNGIEVQATRVESGDQITIGKSNMIFWED